MKDIVWDYVLSVGNDEIDEDHRRLIDLFNMLNHAVAEGESKTYLTALLEELINCTAWHFSHEERLMLRYKYDDYATHRQEHQELLKGVRALQQKLLQDAKPFADTDLEFLEDWLTGHILSVDMRLGSYLATTA